MDAAADGLTAAAKRRDSRHRAEVATLIASFGPIVARNNCCSAGREKLLCGLELHSFNNFLGIDCTARIYYSAGASWAVVAGAGAERA